MASVTGQYPRTRRESPLTMDDLTQVGVSSPTSTLPNSGQRAYRVISRDLAVIVGLEHARRAPEGIWLPPGARELWHISISHPYRYPTWDEIADLRYLLCPEDITMAMLLPPPERYVNVHEHVFHLWQIEDRREDDLIGPRG